MKPSLYLTACLLAALAGLPVLAQSYELPVEHLHTLCNCHGTLWITPEGIEFRAKNAGDSRRWRYPDIRSLKITAPRMIEIGTYEDQKRLLGRDRVFRFRLEKGEIPAEVSALVAAMAARPAVTNVLADSSPPPLYSVPVKHRHTLGGCDGVLRIYPDRVDFESSDTPRDSRSWRYPDLDGVARVERFRLELITLERARWSDYRTWAFELKEDPLDGAVDYIRRQLIAIGKE